MLVAVVEVVLAQLVLTRQPSDVVKERVVEAGPVRGILNRQETWTATNTQSDTPNPRRGGGRRASSAYHEDFRHVFVVNITGHFFQHRQEPRLRIRARGKLLEIQDHPLVHVRATVKQREDLRPRLSRMGQLIRQSRSIQ